ncbi:hypothetical protein BDY19DRAFT_240618 [Irpex rosettiformis]|uniref:Uncharacterized protein n=1 Tax=Irpex rosettiformis TaxID=378272 RepID=A0ACB8U0F7_9APHY|nr:hypothetical protein BDY19DRAFT_240618 [Irpex rosettiformis]
MSPQNDDGNRPIRQRSNTTFAAFNWRRGKTDSAPQQTEPIPPLSLEALIEALTPPAVPSIAHARALASSLLTQAPTPKLAVLTPILAALCAAGSPVSLQVAGYDILAAFWDSASSATLTTADRLVCFSLFLDPSTPWTTELWEPRFKALISLIRSGAETVGIESSLIRVLSTWIDGAFSGLLGEDGSASVEERNERQRSVESLVGLLFSLLERPEFVSRITEADTGGVLQLFGSLIEKSLSSSPDNNIPLTSPSSELNLLSPSGSSGRIPLKHHRHHSSLSILQAPVQKTAIDCIVGAYLRYLDIRLKAIAPVHLNTILPHLFRALAYYTTPLPRLSLTPDTPHQHAMESSIMEKLDALVTGPYSSSCTVILKYHLFPEDRDQLGSMRTSLGALRTLRASIRRVLVTRLARAYISRTSSVSYTPSGAPGTFDIPPELVERAWAKETDLSTWDLNRFRGVLCRSIKSWVESQTKDASSIYASPQVEVILNEIAGMLKDITHAFDETGDELDYEEIEAVGDILRELTSYIRLQRYPDGSSVRITLSQSEAPTNFIATISGLISQVFTDTPLHSVLPGIILSLATHMPDADTAQLLDVMNERQNFSPTTPAWLDNWRCVLSVEDLYSSHRSLTRNNAFHALQSVWDFIKDISLYRRPLAELVFRFWKSRNMENKDDTAAIVVWRMLGDEVVLRTTESFDEKSLASEQTEESGSLAEGIIMLLTIVAARPLEEELDYELVSPPPSVHSVSSTAVSPVLSRMQSEIPTPVQSREPGIPSVMSLLSSLTSGHTSRSQSQPPHVQGYMPLSESPNTSLPDSNVIPTSVGAVVALVTAFSQLAFTSLAALESHLELATRLFTTLVMLLGGTACTKAKLTILQFFMRLRVDRDHRLYFAYDDYDRDSLVAALASLIGRGEKDKSTSAVEERAVDEVDLRKARAKLPLQERTGRRLSRGPGGQPSGSGSSRSRSRAATKILGHPAAVLRRMKPKEPLWTLPETLLFSISSEADTPSERLASYDPACPDDRVILRLSSYLREVLNIIKTAKDWDLLSYALCHLPTQLSNKHLFCGPRSKIVLNDLLATLCNCIQDGTLGSSIDRWPEGINPRDAQGLAYHTLTALISYQRCFEDAQSRHKLIEVFLAGLSGPPSTVKCCLNALSLSAFELQPSMTKYLPRILEKLSQIMTNTAMAVHIIDFLAIVGSLPDLHSNFTEADYKMVFGVALQYLQQHNHPDSSVTISWALSQHVCIMAYYIVYLWFLAVKLPDRPRHIKYITRQLLLANEGRDEIDESTEVCFDWLARYTYASADPRPANSMLSDIIMKSPAAEPSSAEPSISEKSWILGNSVVTIRTLARRGWVEIVSRRASGLSKFLCRAENVPMTTPGDVDPDMVSLIASLVMDRNHDDSGEDSDVAKVYEELKKQSDDAGGVPHPDPITGYVWSKSAPSQRRKDVFVDPSYFVLQLSSYPDNKPSSVGRIIVDSSRLPGFIRSIDRMPVIDTHKVGIMYVAPGQSDEKEILENTHGSPAYTRFLEGIGRLIDLRGQVDVYAGGLDPDEDGEYAYAWWDDIGQVLYHTATLMPSGEENSYTNKKRHIGNDYVRIIWNDSGLPYKFDTLSTQFQFVNIVIEPHSRGAIAAFSNNLHENEYFKVTLQRAAGMSEFTPVGEFKLISAEKLPLLIRQLSLLADWFVDVYQHTKNDTSQVEKVTNWRYRLQAIKRFRVQVAVSTVPEKLEGIMGQEYFRDFTTTS